MPWLDGLNYEEVMLWSCFLKYAPISYLKLTLDGILMSWCHGEVAYANIYDHDEYVDII